MKPRLRTVPETVAFLRMAIANESIHTSLIQTAELAALLDIVEDHLAAPSPAPAVGDLYTYDEYGSVIAALNTARARILGLEEGLRELAMQKKTDEIDDIKDADIEGGYDTMIDMARARLKGQS